MIFIASSSTLDQDLGVALGIGLVALFVGPLVLWLVMRTPKVKSLSNGKRMLVFICTLYGVGIVLALIAGLISSLTNS